MYNILKKVSYIFLLFVTLHITYGSCAGCNNCSAPAPSCKDQQKLPQQQYYILADSSILGQPEAQRCAHSEIIAISELKNNPKPEDVKLPPPLASPSTTASLGCMKQCIQTFDPYTTFVKTFYGTHTEMSTATHCIPIQPSSASVIYQPIQPIACPMPTASKPMELLSNNQLLGLIYEQLCVENDRLRLLLNELSLKAQTVTNTLYLTKTIAYSPTSAPGIAPINHMPAHPPCFPSITHYQQASPQMRMVVATSTYLLPAYGPSYPSCAYKSAADSF